jgi:phosphoenolpyruvate carboxykinase (ATP)
MNPQTQTTAQSSASGLEAAGLRSLNAVHWNLRATALYEISIQRGEGRLAASGPLVVTTGRHTGRSASDKFIVKDANTADQVCWDYNKAMTPGAFETLHHDMAAYAEGRELFVQDLFAGADAAYRLPVRVVTERAWHSLFIRNLLIEPDADALAAFAPAFTIIDLPGFAADPLRHGCESTTVIAVDFSRRLVLIGGTSYGGEIKKSVFTILNYLLPADRVMPMHCSANIGAAGDVAVFFGLSGTGKTTLSADPSRILVGDDEHGWGQRGVFNFEGGCYAKVIRLSREAEPGIFAVTERFGTVLENVVCDPATGKPDFDDNRYTENTRAAYPIDFVPHASSTGRAGQPSNVIMLTADAFGVLPPIAKLTPSQAMYHFLSGFTAKVAGTEKGLGSEPQPTFSACFGAPFMPRHPAIYGALLRDLIAEHKVDCWLINTGWTGGAYGAGKRMPIGVTRRLLAAALDGQLAQVPMRTDPYFGFQVPADVPGVDKTILDPRSTWHDGAAYDRQARKLVEMFHANFTAFETHVAPEVLAAAPHLPA